MNYTVKLFGPYADAVGRSELTLRFDRHALATSSELIARLAELHPRLEPLLVHGKLAVNCVCVRPTHTVRPEDELAVIGLVGGG